MIGEPKGCWQFSECCCTDCNDRVGMQAALPMIWKRLLIITGQKSPVSLQDPGYSRAGYYREESSSEEGAKSRHEMIGEEAGVDFLGYFVS
ncbi:hypothetical protein BaRGS_00017283 [Batillaria attramentaria]|uniref:Uncharacterized protein n=1 Tax=Batillaria attramentaria TaxID=370345 RepID=A0ABD0KX21_9CAEN